MSEITDELNFATRFLQIKQNVQNFEEIKLAKTQATHQEAKDQLESLQNEQETIKASITKVLNSTERYLYYHQLDVLSVKQSLQQANVQQAHANVEKQRDKVVKAYQESERWKTLVGQYQEQSQQETKSIEQKELDEGAGVRFRLTQNG